MNALFDVRRLIDVAAEVYRNGGTQAEPALDDLDRCTRRLAEPLRIALAGQLKAGKSTLLNALVGEELAPTAATECTRTVMWFRHGSSPSVHARHVNGLSAAVPIERRDGHVDFGLDGVPAADIERIDVCWPTTELARRTIIDTPGTASLNAEVSARTMRLLAPEHGVSEADAVVYLMRTSTASDVSMLAELSKQVGGRGGPLGVVGVVSRADELGVGRIDAMLSAREVAAQYAADLAASGLCQAVVPVAGLLALTARTLRQSEFVALSSLAAASPEDLQLALLSVDRFTRDPSPLPVAPDARRDLVVRFGVFGIRIAIGLIQSGVRDATSLADALLERSGLVELQSIIDVQFGQRAGQLKAHSALAELDRILRRNPTQAAAGVERAVQQALADTHGFVEVRMLGLLRSRRTTLSESELVEVTRVLGGYGTSADDRLGLDPFATMTSGRSRAVATVQRWRGRAEHPLNDAFTTRLCIGAARSAEGIIADMDDAARRERVVGAPAREVRRGSRA